MSDLPAPARVFHDAFVQPCLPPRDVHLNHRRPTVSQRRHGGPERARNVPQEIWDLHTEDVYREYIYKNLSLKQTMGRFRTRYSFGPS